MVYQKIIQYCSKNNLSISAFEKLCGIGNGTVGRWNPEIERFSNPSFDTLVKISKATGITMAELVTAE